MKKFIKLERIITEEQFAIMAQVINKKYRPLGIKETLSKFNTTFRQCGNVASQAAIFQDDGCTIRETYCNDCIKKERHTKQPEINVFNFDQFFDAIPEYRDP
jgi:hypothetical protein